jgi:hypothetical protein
MLDCRKPHERVRVKDEQGDDYGVMQLWMGVCVSTRGFERHCFLLFWLRPAITLTMTLRVMDMESMAEERVHSSTAACIDTPEASMEYD